MATGGADDVYVSEVSGRRPDRGQISSRTDTQSEMQVSGRRPNEGQSSSRTDTQSEMQVSGRRPNEGQSSSRTDTQSEMQVSGRRPTGGQSSSRTDTQSEMQVSGRRSKQSGVLNTPQAGNSTDVKSGIKRMSLSTSTSMSSGNVYTTATLKHSVNVSRESDEVLCEIRGLCKLGDKLIVCDKYNCKLKVFDSCYKFLYEYWCDNKPLDICMIDDDTVAVSIYGGNMKVMCVGNDAMKELNNINTKYGGLGVCFYEGKIYCVVRYRIASERVSDIRVYTPGGQIKRRYEHLSDGKVECNCLEYITVNPHIGILYVTDWYKGVVALSTSGDVIAVMSLPQLKNPQGIAVDDYGHIYACGTNSHNVIQMSANGDNIVEFLSNNPRCRSAQVVVIYGNKMFLARRRSGTISIYELS